MNRMTHRGTSLLCFSMAMVGLGLVACARDADGPRGLGGDHNDVADGSDDAVPTCDSPQTLTLTDARQVFGVCEGECEHELSLGGASPEACRAVALATRRHDRELIAINRGSLTDAGAEEAVRVTANLVDVALESQYGCPNCADDGATTITLLRDGTSSEHEYETFRPPTELSEVDTFVNTLLDALLACQSNDFVTVSEPCEDGEERAQ